ncbi:IS4 family transposase [Thauera sp. 28]|nr:IS4 family transposase [Thauera sp. 28]
MVTNAEGLAAQSVTQRYKSLANIERGVKVLKSEIEIGPVYHGLPERIRAHASICFLALRGSTLNPDFRPFSESAFSTGAGFKAMIAKALWWHVCNSNPQT